MSTSLKTRKPLARIGKKDPKCRVCKRPFKRERVGQPVCQKFDCMEEWVKQYRAKTACAPYRAKPVRNTKARRELLANDKGYVERQARAYCHRWIKWRDVMEAERAGIALVCIACQKPMNHLPQSAIHASHFRPSGMNSAIRFEPDNIHLCDSGCNKEKSGNLTDYETNLVIKIGRERVEWLKSQNHVKRWTIEELREIRDDFGARLKALDIILPRVH